MTIRTHFNVGFSNNSFNTGIFKVCLITILHKKKTETVISCEFFGLNFCNYVKNNFVNCESRNVVVVRIEMLL